MNWNDEMMRALEADGEKLRQMTGEDHGPVFLADQGWRPIETAPKDGTEFLGYWPDFYGSNSWNIERTWFADGQWTTPNYYGPPGDPESPTYWSPLSKTLLDALSRKPTP